MENNDILIKSSSILKKEDAALKFDSTQTINTDSYHKEELLLNKAIIINAIIMIWIGIITIIGFTIAYILGCTDNIFVSFAGVFIDFFSGTILYLVNNSTKTKNEYFKESAKVDSEKRIISLIEKCEDEKFKQKQIDKLVENYCNK